MSESLSRRQFVQVASGSCGLLAIAPAISAQTAQQTAASTKPAAPQFDKGPAVDSELVRRTVGEAHRDLSAVTSLVNADPELANCCWDWGGGDYETPLGASAHTGQTEIARFLLDNGARLDVFAAAMLGMLDVVKAAIEADDTTRYCLGPHGLTLMHHAEVGEEQSAAVKEYLVELYRNDKQARNIPLSPRAVRRYVGTFAVAKDPSQVFRFIEIDRVVHWQANSATSPALTNRGNHVLVTDTGPRSARFVFAVRKGFAQAVTIELDGATIEAERVPA